MSKLIQKLNNLIKLTNGKKTACFGNISQKFRVFGEDMKSIIDLELKNDHRLKSSILICLIALFGYVVLFKQNYAKVFYAREIRVEQKSPQETEREKFKQELRILVKGHPIERMVPYIVKKDKKTAAYLIGIAKKESNWGKRVPVLAGQDCYNYWGFRMERERMGSGGHTCFDSPREAVAVVSLRIAEIIERNDAQSAEDLLVWKCGSSCAATGGQAAANKWARDVDYYADKVLN